MALGVNLAGEKEVLGLWIAETEGAKFWQSEKLALPVRTMSEANINAAC
jgi:transposase-like protein